MAAYLVVDTLEVTDPAGLQEYGKGTGPLVAKHGGKVLSRGEGMEALEGDWKPGRLVIIEFPDRAALEAWYNSAEYKPLIEKRQASAKANLVAVNGL